ncbi:uncharacterized protein LOC108681384 [Hyalella azteca]|uniref:Uncharacterized protein LOC108681384 n=1 Tax=Hyalella azteca TaxID=294128 RepID=A0A8B7PKC2_HYAAZ|nr:uncharacterized protein LOC108681384 [Hyalella azteca]
MSQSRKGGGRDSSRSRTSRDSYQGLDSPHAASTGHSTPSNASSSASSDSNTPTLQLNSPFSPVSHSSHQSGCISTTYNPFNNMSGTNPHHHGSQSVGNSPMTGNRIVKTWRQMGGKTKSKTRDILKRWQTMNNGQASEDSLAGGDDLSDVTEPGDGGGHCPGAGDSCKKNSWSVHVWTTWVRRPYEEDDSEQIPEGKNFLSDFQVEKFTYYFTDVFDHNKDRVITIEDILALNERMRHYAGWHEDNEYFITMKEIHSDFFECLLEHVGRIEPEYGFEFDVDRIPDRVQMYQWLNMWGNLTHGAKAMIDFPVWLQILPKILFKVINRRDNGVISWDELRCFYAHFIKLREEQVTEVTHEAYNAFTSCGDFPLTENVYLMSFANFLLGKTPHGPGKYIFGGFKDSDVGQFQIDYSCLRDSDET